MREYEFICSKCHVKFKRSINVEPDTRSVKESVLYDMVRVKCPNGDYSNVFIMRT